MSGMRLWVLDLKRCGGDGGGGGEKTAFHPRM